MSQIKQLNWNWLISVLRFQKVLSPWWSGLMEGNGNVLTVDICQARNSMWSVTWRLSTWHPLNMSVPTAPAHLRIELLWKITWQSFIKTDVLNFVFSSFVPDKVESHMARLDGGAWQCLDCGYQSSKKFSVKIHVEAKHVTTSGYICPRCPSIHKNRIALMNHTAKFHKNSWKFLQFLYFFSSRNSRILHGPTWWRPVAMS